ncbi:hypothetical protein GCM10008927_12200 [Amylibacter ulvae]|uniref:O-GlcNAc transferase C-terminal domain-containing protein n=2 Tax=Paramylibacter ulvae TaxID=1651968 RepID=A0ABQ3CZG6_9RHOB|nr:hypothetical protein GCM10008927_12200 [Amylibacter ulvae]
MIAILNALRVATDYDIDFKLYWLITDTMSDEIKDPSQIFSQNFIDKYFVAKDSFESLQPDMFEVAYRNPGWDEAKLKSEIAKGKNLLLSHAFASVATFPHEDEKQVRKGVAAAFDRLEFNPVVASMIDKINIALDDTPPIAYHIRRGDIIDPNSNAANKVWPKKYTPREFYHIHLQRHCEKSDGKILVFSDEPREVDRLKSMSSHVLALDDMIDTDILNDAQFDFLSLYAMSRCHEIIGPPGSAFSETAALFGNGTVTDVQETLSPEDHDSALALLVSHLDSGPEHFLGLADVGQTLPFASQYWLKKNQSKQGAAITRKYLDMGLNRAYIYVILCELYLGHDDAQAALDIRALAQKQELQFDIAMATINLMCVRAHLAQNDKSGAIQSLCLSLWSFPNIQGAEKTTLQMVLNKLLTPENFFPFDLTLTRFALPGSPAAGGNKVGGIIGKKPIEIPFVSIDMISRDWSLFLGKRRHRLFHHKDRIEMLFSRIKSVCERCSPQHAFDSMVGLYALEMGDVKRALKLHRAATDAMPKNALYQKRLGDALIADDQIGKGIRTLKHAAELEPNQILFTAHLAEAQVKNKQVDDGIESYRSIVARADNYPEIVLKAALALSRKKNHREQARKLGLIALENSQGSARVLNAYATILKRCGSKNELLAILSILQEVGTLRPAFQKIYDKLSTDFKRKSA